MREIKSRGKGAELYGVFKNFDKEIKTIWQSRGEIDPILVNEHSGIYSLQSEPLESIVDAKMIWEKLKEQLPPVELFVLVKRLGFTLEEIGEQLNVTKERVRQIEGRAIRRCRINARKLGIKEIGGWS